MGQRIQDLKAKLLKIQARKEREVAARGDVPTVSLVGYTNAGKSTLMNALTDAGVLVEDKLFATLDTRTRRWQFRGGGHVLLSDTVGFIRDLPHSLVASFKATLEEARQADLLLHVVDASSPEAEKQIESVKRVLDELELLDHPTILVLNKVDRVSDQSLLDVLKSHYNDSITISAARGEGIDRLEQAVREALHERARRRDRDRRRERPSLGISGAARADSRPRLSRRPRRPRLSIAAALSRLSQRPRRPRPHERRALARVTIKNDRRSLTPFLARRSRVREERGASCR